MSGAEPLDSRVSNTNASTDSTTKQKKESKLSLRKNQERRRASKEASTSSTSSSATAQKSNNSSTSLTSSSAAAQKSNTAHNATLHDSKKDSTSSISSTVTPKSDIMHSLYHSSKPKIELTAEIVTVDDSKNTKVKKQSILSSSKTKGMMESSENSTSSSSKFKSANHNSSSEQIPCDSANVTNVQITSIDKAIDQMKTIVNSNNTITEQMVPTHVLLGWISTLQQHNDSPGTKLTIQKKPLNDISNTCTDELSQEQSKEISQETDEEIPQLIVRDEDEDPDPVYVPKVWTKPFEDEKEKMASAAQFPDKPVVDYHGSDEESKTKLINNFGLYDGVLQKTDLNRYTSMSYQERKDLPQKEIKFANGDEVLESSKESFAGVADDDVQTLVKLLEENGINANLSDKLDDSIQRIIIEHNLADDDKKDEYSDSESNDTLEANALAYTEKGSLSELRKLSLNTSGVQAIKNARDEKLNTCLHIAAKIGCYHTTRWLISEMGMEVNTQNLEGYTSYEISKQSGQNKRLILLLEKLSKLDKQ